MILYYLMIRLIVITLISLLFFEAPAQFPAPKIDQKVQIKPQSKGDWDKPGSYEIVASVSNSVIYDHSDSIDVLINITGYGLVGDYKIFFSISDPIFSDESVLYGVRGLYSRDGKVQIQFGSNYGPASIGKGFVIHPGGLGGDGTWKYETLMYDFDITDSSLSIQSEMQVDSKNGGVVRLNLKPIRDIKPGNYIITLILTYFDGSIWRNSKTELPIHVNTFWEEYTWLINLLTILGVAYATISLWLQITDYTNNRRNNNLSRTSDSEVTSEKKVGKRKKTEEQKLQKREYLKKFVWKAKMFF